MRDVQKERRVHSTFFIGLKKYSMALRETLNKNHFRDKKRKERKGRKDVGKKEKRKRRERIVRSSQRRNSLVRECKAARRDIGLPQLSALLSLLLPPLLL